MYKILRVVKQFALLLCLMLVFSACIATTACAEGLYDMPVDFFSWGAIGTFAGAVAMTVFIVQAIKLPLDKAFGHVPTRFVVYVIALALLIMSQVFVGDGLTFEIVCQSVMNAFLVMLSAMSTYSMLIEKPEKKKELPVSSESGADAQKQEGGDRNTKDSQNDNTDETE